MPLYEDKEGVVFLYEVRGDEVAIYSLYILPEKKRDVVIPSKINGLPVTEISPMAFRGREIEHISLPESITAIYSYAFEGCSLLREINLPKNLSVLCFRAFAKCISLESVIIPYKTAFESEVFEGCTNLKTAKIEHAPWLPSGVFKNCGLRKIYLPDSIDGISGTAFEGVSKNMRICGNNEYIKSFAIKYGFKYGESQLEDFLNAIQENDKVL